MLRVCPCSHSDFQCDFGFVRDPGQGKRVKGKGGRSTACVKDPEFEDYDPQEVLANCQAGDNRGKD